MRTTVEIDDHVLAAARSLARARGISLGAAISELALRGLRSDRGRVEVAYADFPVLRGNPGHPVSDELVGRFRDDE